MSERKTVVVYRIVVGKESSSKNGDKDYRRQNENEYLL